VQTIAGTWVWAGDDCDAAEAEFPALVGERTNSSSLVLEGAMRNPEWSDAPEKAAGTARLPVAERKPAGHGAGAEPGLPTVTAKGMPRPVGSGWTAVPGIVDVEDRPWCD
jgi:hypothetical protein